METSLKMLQTGVKETSRMIRLKANQKSSYSRKKSESKTKSLQLTVSMLLVSRMMSKTRRSANMQNVELLRKQNRLKANNLST